MGTVTEGAALAEWLQSSRFDFQHFATLTFKKPKDNPLRALESFKWWCNVCFENAADTVAFAAVETFKASDSTHIHAIIQSDNFWRKRGWRLWHQFMGRARIEPIASVGLVAGYCAKYVTKEVHHDNSWYDFWVHPSYKTWQKQQIRWDNLSKNPVSQR